jgi:hypothetical protein
VCLLIVPNIFIKKQFPDNRARLRGKGGGGGGKKVGIM